MVKPEDKTLTLYTFFDADDEAVATRAFPGSYVGSEHPDAAAMGRSLGAASWRDLGEISLPAGNVATAVEHDYDRGAKVRVGVWRNDSVGGLWRAPWVDYRFVVTNDQYKMVSGPATVLMAFVDAQRASIADPKQEYAVRWWDDARKRGGRRIATFVGGSDQR